VGWIPFVFLAIVVLGFLTWEGGLFGIQVPNPDYQRFESDLQAGRHVLFVEVEPEGEEILQSVMARHPRLVPAGSEDAAPERVAAVTAEKRWRRFVNWAP
jgi:hypothetical protein